MNKKLKKFFGFLLSLAMVISLFPAGAITVSAAEVDEVNVASESIDGTSGGTWGGIDWTLTSDGTLTIAPTVNEITKIKPYSKTNPKELYQVGEVPAAVNDAITAITGWPFNRTAVKKLVIEEGITSIGSFALQGLTNLTGEVVIPSTVTYIGQEAFQKSSMTKLTFAKGNTGELCIGPGAFKTLDITELVLPEDPNSIHIHCWAFNGCKKLEKIVLPANVDFSSAKTYGWTHAEYEGMDYVYGTYASSSDIFATCPNIKSIAFGNEEVKTNFFNMQGNQATFNKLSGVTVEVKLPSVAMIGEQGYETLADALEAANAGDTITFVADITEDVTISKAVTIDGAEMTYTGVMTLKADTTIKNVNFDGNGYNGYAVEARGAQYVTIEDCTAKNYMGFLQIPSATTTTAVKGITVTDVQYGVKVDYSNTVVLENVDMTASVAAVLNSNYGEKTITIKNSKLSILGTWDRNDTIKTNYVFEGENTIGTFIVVPAIDNFKLAAGATLTAPEGITVTTADDDYEVKYENGIYTSVAKPSAVVYIGKQGYETLANALAAANVGDTITFDADINENVTINKAVTIDGLGKTYTGAMTLKADTTIKNVNFDGKDYNGYAVTTRGASYLNIEDCTAKNYGYGFVQLASGTVLTTVKNVTASNMNYGVKVDYSNAVVLENVDMTAGVAAVLNSNYGGKTITIKNSKLNILGTWTRNNTIKTNYEFEGANTIDQFITDAAIDTFKLAAGSTLTAPKVVTVTTDVENCTVAYKSGVYSVVVNPVAQVGVTKYETLQEAIDACPAGGKVTLLRNAKGPGVVIDKDITINFNGKSYTITEPVGSTGTESNGFQILAGNKVTLSAGTLKVAEEAADKFYILIQNYADLSCFHMNLDGTYLDKWSKTDGDSYVISNNSGYISLTGKTYITTNNDGDKAFAFDACDSKYYADKPVVFAAATVKIDKKAVSESYDKIEAAARIGSTQFFAALKDAFAYASDGNTIKLMADVAVSEGITNSKKVTLDLNGKTITGTDNATGSFAIITNKGALTVTGNGKITLTATNNRGWNAYSSVISNTVGGKLIVESGTIEHLGGTDMAYAIDNLTNGKGTYAETIINGGTIKSTYRAIRMFLNGVEANNILNVKGGTVEGSNKAIWMQDPSKNANTGNLTITKGATINGDVYLDVTEGSTEFPVEVSIVKSAVIGKVLTENFPEGYKLVETKGVYSVEKVKVYIAKVGVTKYESLQEAIDACSAGGKVTLLRDAKGPGVVINKNITILFNGHTYTIKEPVGSAGTETLGFQILKGNKVVLNNGKIEIAEEAADKFAILIQNYADLTVYQMTLDGTNLGRYENYSYVLSVNSGKVTVNGKSVLTAKDGEGNYALDVYDYSSAGYSLPTVTVTSVAKINGKISAGAKYSTVYYATVEQAKAANPNKNVTVLN